MTDLTRGLAELDAATPAYNLAAQMYAGTAPELIDNHVLRDKLRSDDEGYRVNYARIVVASRLDKLEVSAVTVTDRTGTGGPAQAVIDELIQDEAVADEAHDVHEVGVSRGDSYVIVWPREVDQAGNATALDVTYASPLSTRAVYADGDYRTPAYVVSRWEVADGDTRKLRVNVYYADRVERWITAGSAPRGRASNAEDFVPFVDDAETTVDATGVEVHYPGTWPIPTPLGVLPVFHFRTSRPYGRPEHRDAYGPQQAIDKLTASQMSSIDFVVLPQRYGIRDATVDGGVSAVDEDFGGVETEIGSDAARTDSDEGLHSKPGSLWDLPGKYKSVGEFSPANQAAFLDPWDRYAHAMSVVTKTPVSAFRIGGVLPSGAARRADDAPLNGRVADLQRRFGTVWRDVYRYALELLGFPDVGVDVTWAPLETFDDKDSWDVAAAQLKAGVPLRRVLTERGYTNAQCDEWGVPDYGEVSAAQHASTVATTAAAMRDLGTASALGAISPETMNAVVGRMAGG